MVAALKVGKRRRWQRPRGLGLLLAVLAVVGTEQAFERWAAHTLVDAPNGGVPIAPPRRGELRLTVGPPDATLSVETVAPKLPPRATIFVLPGLRDDKEYMRAYAERLAEAGYRAVLVDSRGHGRSGGQWLTYGVQESRDLSQLIDALAITGPIGVLGHSYGGSTALQWAGREPRLRAAIGMGAFTTLRECVRDLPIIGTIVPHFILERAIERASRMAHFDPDEADARRAVQKTQAAVLIVHGSLDPIVPVAHAHSLAAAGQGHSQLVILDGQDHENLAGDPRLWSMTLDFLSRVFP
jgi:pimeloyl-ACP methyl ester carboxylesterase